VKLLQGSDHSIPEARRKGKKTEKNGKTRILELCPRTAVVTGSNRSFFSKVEDKWEKLS
jgi:hypothetical protein